MMPFFAPETQELLLHKRVVSLVLRWIILITVERQTTAQAVKQENRS
jgi:hypothetical protein